MNKDTRSKLNEKAHVPEDKAGDKGGKGADQHKDRGSSGTGSGKPGGETGEKSPGATEPNERSNQSDDSVEIGKYEREECPEEDWPGPRSHDDSRF